jgi:NADPH-dependent 2,4-dienoyl-CoA reductase/sulfur reductase-like enzyme
MASACVLARVACEPLSTVFREQHEKHGVRFELNAGVTGFEGEGCCIKGVKLADGRVIPCDAAVVGVGAKPNDELAIESGLESARGVVVDLEARTSDPRIFAIGDVALRPMPVAAPPATSRTRVGSIKPGSATPWRSPCSNSPRTSSRTVGSPARSGSPMSSTASSCASRKASIED